MQPNASSSGMEQTGEKFGKFFTKGVKKIADGFQNFVSDFDEGVRVNDILQPDDPAYPGPLQAPIEYNLAISIEEVITGANKKIKVSRKVYSENNSYYTETAILEVPVKKGVRAGTRITYPSAGDRYPGKKPVDLVFILRDKPHEYFIRDKDDLTYTCKISLWDAICGCTIHIPLPVGGTHELTINEVLRPNSTRRLSGQGIPNNRSGVRGDLIVKFDIEFPKEIRPDMKEVFEEMYN